METMWYVEIWPKKGPMVSDVLELTDQEATVLGSRLADMMKRRLLVNFNLDRWTSLPLSEFEVRVLDRIETGRFD